MNHRLHVGNLSATVSAATLTETFAKAGHPITKVSLVMSRDPGVSRGFAFLDMPSPEAASAAMAGLQGADLDAKPMRISIAHAPKSRFGGSTGGLPLAPPVAAGPGHQ